MSTAARCARYGQAGDLFALELLENQRLALPAERDRPPAEHGLVLREAAYNPAMVERLPLRTTAWHADRSMAAQMRLLVRAGAA